MKHTPLKELLQSVLDHANGHSLTVQKIFTLLRHQGLALLIVIFSAPFLFPFQIPGLSLFFGIGTLFFGLQIALPKHSIFPKRLVEKEVSYPMLEKWIGRAQWIVEKVNKFVYHRLPGLVHSKGVIRFNGWCVFFLSFIFIIPIPLPFTNFLAAIPIFLIGLGTLEEDGLIILLAYIFGLICLAGFVAVIWFGVEGISLI